MRSVGMCQQGPWQAAPAAGDLCTAPACAAAASPSRLLLGPDLCLLAGKQPGIAKQL